MYKIPGDTKQFIQTNTSDILGNLYATYNCDFDRNVGNVSVGRRLVLNTATADVSELTSYPAAFKNFNGALFTVAGTKPSSPSVGYVFKASSNALTTTFSKVTASNSPAICDSQLSDILVANSTMYVTTGTNSVYWTGDGTTWGTPFTVGASSVSDTHMLTSYAGRVYMTTLGSAIYSWSTQNGSDVAVSGQYTLQLGNTNSNIITFIRSSANRIWIGTVDTTGGKGYVHEWDGSATQVSKSYRLEASGALSCVIKDDVPYVVDSNGSLLAWNGGTFVKIANFYTKKNKVLFNPFSASNQRFVHPNGMAVISGKIHILADLTYIDVASHLGTQDDCNPSGIWVYDPDIKTLRHKYSFGLTKSGSTITDYGQIRIFGAGAISEIVSSNSNSAITTNGKFLSGCSYYTDATTTTSGIFYDDNDDTLKKSGFFITTKLGSQTLRDMWNKAYITHEAFINASDKMVIKYRGVEDTFTEAVITWTSTTTFTSTASLGSYVMGDEVQVVQGIGSGLCSHITAISFNAGTYTVTVDETYTGATGTARARFQKWVKAGVIQDVEDFDEVAINIPSTWMQLKVFMLWTGANELAEVAITNQPHRKYE